MVPEEQVRTAATELRTARAMAAASRAKQNAARAGQDLAEDRVREGSRFGRSGSACSSRRSPPTAPSSPWPRRTSRERRHSRAGRRRGGPANRGAGGVFDRRRAAHHLPLGRRGDLGRGVGRRGRPRKVRGRQPGYGVHEVLSRPGVHRRRGEDRGLDRLPSCPTRRFPSRATNACAMPRS